MAGGARGRSCMDSFPFHPARPSFHQSASIGRGISPPFPLIHGPSLHPNSSILTSLLCPDERGYNPETPSNFWNNPKDSDIG